MTVDYTSFPGLMATANSATGGLYGAVLPFLLFVIVYAYSSVYGFPRAFATAGFIAFISTIPLFAMGIVSGYIIVLTFVLALIGIFQVSR